MLSTNRFWKDFTASAQAGMDLYQVAGCTPLIRIWLIHDGLWVGRTDALVLARLWEACGDGLPAKAQEHPPTWQRSIALGMQPRLIAFVADLAAQPPNQSRTRRSPGSRPRERSVGGGQGGA